MKKNIINIAHRAAALAAANSKKSVSAVILAGGASTRMGGISKQLLEIYGVPAIVRSAQAFDVCDDVSEIIIVCRKDDMKKTDELMRTYKISKFKCVTPGGASRYESSKKGFEKVSSKADFVAVHDAARCLITPEQIEKVIAAAKKSGAAIAASPVTDTIKLSDEKTGAIKTLDRSLLWRAQTPQIFVKDMLEAALYMPHDFEPTDDSSLVEALGFKVTPVDCGFENIKLTTPADVFVAEEIIKGR